MRHITIVGGGQAGLALAVGLLDTGYKVRLAQNRTAQRHFRSARSFRPSAYSRPREVEERRLGLDLWNADSARALGGVRLSVAAPDGSGNKAFGFVGKLQARRRSPSISASSFTRFMDEVAQRGGTVEIAEVGVPELERYAADSDLVIIAAGKGPVSQLVRARHVALALLDRPMRALSLVYAHGVKPHER